MKRIFFALIPLLLPLGIFAQHVSAQLAEALRQFESDAQLKNAILSLYVVDAKREKVIFDKNGGIGLAPASTQKIITAASAYELLGKDFRYQTQFGIDHTDGNTIFYVYPFGDPTLGSWRWPQTTEAEVKKRIVKALKARKLLKIDYVLLENSGWQEETIPDGWIWQDIGNYYGAGADILNWRENQYDVVLKSGSNVGDQVEVVRTVPFIYGLKLTSVVEAAAKGSGDNAYVYYPLNEQRALIRGTIPAGETGFIISAAMPSPSHQFLQTLFDTLKRENIKVADYPFSQVKHKSHTRDIAIVHQEFSPTLDSIIYWLNRKSINLYGEALVKTIGAAKKSVGSTGEGVKIIKAYWDGKGIPQTALNIVDGSGLSPLNRVTTHAQVRILQYAKKEPWFPGFYDSLPEYNGMKMKSGTIRGVKGFCGYHTSKSGIEYIFSFLVNNYNGSASSLVQKMYKVLDHLK